MFGPRVKGLLVLAVASVMELAGVRLAVAEAPVPENVAIADSGVTLQAYLFKPAGAGPFPVVVAMNDCRGLTEGSNGVRPSYRDWAERFNKAGLAVLFPDSLGSRELGAQCGARNPTLRPAREGVADISAVRQWLAGQDWATPGHLTLVGWGLGANSVLWAIRPQVKPASSEADFRSAVVLYPSCQQLSRLGWSSRVPTLVLAGSKRDPGATKACQQMVDNAKGRSALAQLSAYPDQNGVVGSVDDKSSNTSAVRSLTASTDGAKRVTDWLKR